MTRNVTGVILAGFSTTTTTTKTTTLFHSHALYRRQELFEKKKKERRKKERLGKKRTERITYLLEATNYRSKKEQSRKKKEDQRSQKKQTLSLSRLDGLSDQEEDHERVFPVGELCISILTRTTINCSTLCSFSFAARRDSRPEFLPLFLFCC